MIIVTTFSTRHTNIIVCDRSLMYRSKSGDKYNGRISAGKAHGMGVLAYASGEKYKGDFRKDMRCGRGVCCYPNGAK